MHLTDNIPDISICCLKKHSLFTTLWALSSMFTVWMLYFKRYCVIFFFMHCYRFHFKESKSPPSASQKATEKFLRCVGWETSRSVRQFFGVKGALGTRQYMTSRSAVDKHTNHLTRHLLASNRPNKTLSNLCSLLLFKYSEHNWKWVTLRMEIMRDG